MSTKASDFTEVKLRLASPERIRSWSHGEVLKPETINYRTQKPEKDGLFSEEIFGPTKDWECYCGKYKRIRYKGIVCDKCGVEVTRSIVRRERMGHIELAVPVSHIWFLRGVPSKLGLVLDLSAQELEKVIYFASYIITDVDESAKEQALKQIENEFKQKRKEIQGKYKEMMAKVKQEKTQAMAKDKSAEKQYDEKIYGLAQEKSQHIEELNSAADVARKELKSLRKLQIISEIEYRDLSMKYGQVFEAGIGAEAIRKVVGEVELDRLARSLDQKIRKSVASKKRRLSRRLELVKGMNRAKVHPEWMVLTALPVTPPDIRPMVQLDGGRFASSDLNDLYRRVINRNNRLKRLIKLNAPEVIQRNEKRMLQEAVDALIDNSARRGKALTASTGQKRTLKSLADMLKGKQGRFRQNLLGKRVDYSGRSVIVVGPTLKLTQCGIPKRMALELFKPFVINRLIEKEMAYNVRSAGKLIEEQAAEVWDCLDEVIKGNHVLLNRAPTLHRLGIQAFEPVLIEGKAIQIHPMVCIPFNADFDGDQMAVHVPLTKMARYEAANIMLSVRNLLTPATGDPVATANQDIILGSYIMTFFKPKAKGEGKTFGSFDEAILAHNLDHLSLQARINVRSPQGKIIETSVGRIIFNKILPKELGFVNEIMDKKRLRSLISEALSICGVEGAGKLINKMTSLSFEYLTRSGISLGMDDSQVPPEKNKLVAKAEEAADKIRKQFEAGLLTDEERHLKLVDIWSQVVEDITVFVKKSLKEHGSVKYMIESGARGNWGQTTQLTGMKGLVVNPAGRIIELPIKDNLKEGFNVLEYFISTHGTRKGMSDTALRTANAGYLTRRLVDVSQDIVIREEECGDKEGLVIKASESEAMGQDFAKRLVGRIVLSDVVDDKTGEVLITKGELVTRDQYDKLSKAKLSKAHIRSVLACKAKRGICRNCYGYDLGVNKLVEKGAAVGIIAAQSIGEPGTQLTMRTFHSGGVASEEDITQGLPRVEEIFEARPIKKPAIVAEANGRVQVEEKTNQKIIRIINTDVEKDEFPIAAGDQVEVEDKSTVRKGSILIKKQKGRSVKAGRGGTVIVKKDKVELMPDNTVEKEYIVPKQTTIWTKDGELITKGTQITEGHVDLHSLYKLCGPAAVQKYILSEVQHIYTTQGQEVSDKHIEIIVRQMFSRFRVKEPGGTGLLTGRVISWSELCEAQEEAKSANKEMPQVEQLLLGITKASLSTDSFLAAASFQETARVLIDAAVMGKSDQLRGLKENVIIGKLIPAGTGYLDYFKQRQGQLEDNEAEAAVQAAKEQAESKEKAARA